LLDDRLGKSKSATRWLEQATLLEPWNSWYQYQLANILARTDAGASITPFGIAISWEPDNQRFRLGRARAYESLGAWDRAREDQEWASRHGSRSKPAPDQPSR
jgi:Flp pilus assembly protein TadD